MSEPTSGPGQVPDESKLVGAAEGLVSQLAEVVQKIPAIEARERVTRRITFALIASFILDIALTIVLAVNLVSTHNQAVTLHANQVAACQNTNSTRAAERLVWEDLFQAAGSASRQPGETEAQYQQGQAKLKTFLALVNSNLAPINCAKQFSTGG